MQRDQGYLRDLLNGLHLPEFIHYRHFACLRPGTDGTVFAPFQDIHQPYYIFAPQICRSLRATYNRKSKYKGIKTKRFLVDLDMSNNEFNSSCYCREDGFCSPNGTYNIISIGSLSVLIASCNKKSTFFSTGVHDMFACVGTPFGLSAPHFYNGIIPHVFSPNKFKHSNAKFFLLSAPNSIYVVNRKH